MLLVIMGCFLIEFTTILNFYSSNCSPVDWIMHCYLHNQKTTHSMHMQECMVDYSAGTYNPHNFSLQSQMMLCWSSGLACDCTIIRGCRFHCHLAHSHILQHLAITTYALMECRFPYHKLVGTSKKMKVEAIVWR